ncbi:MAG: hypothetical protein G8D58_09745 [gamma proteobacterium symbiont of Phacoides pectinatus]
MREIADHTLLFLEDLDAARERASVTQEELLHHLSEQAERRMFLLAVITTVFLPLSFVTGLLGINVGGIPGADEPVRLSHRYPAAGAACRGCAGRALVAALVLGGAHRHEA